MPPKARKSILSSTLTPGTSTGSSTSKAAKPLSQFLKPVFERSTSASSSTNAKASTLSSKSKGKKKAESPVASEYQLWVDKYQPENADELSVHKRKAEDVRKWLNDSFSGGPGGKLKKFLRILILTGAAGTGKTATIRVLAKELGFEIMEWRNAVDDNVAGDEFESMSVKFETFLSRASSYSSLSFKSSTQLTTKRLILLEDLPNILHLGTRETFHSALESFVHATPTCPLVIIVSDSGTRGEARDSAGGWQAGGSKDVAIDIRSVLPKSLLGGPYVTEIKFNPIAVTLLRKGLNSLLDRHCPPSSSQSSLQRPSKEAVDAVIDSSNGDIRSAIMALQFASVVTLSSGGKNKKAREKAVKGVFEAITRREQSLALFHLLGKIFYNKRYGEPLEEDKDPMPKPPRLPPHLSEHKRSVSKVDPDVLYHDSPVDASLLLLYVHQNYTQFCNEIEEISCISERLSIADSILGGSEMWTHHASLHPYAFSSMTSGVIHALPSPVERRGQKMYKSDWFDIMKKTRDAEDAVERVRAVLEKLSDEGRRWGKDVIVRELSCVLKAGGNEAFDFPPDHSKFSTLVFSAPTMSQSQPRGKQLDGDDDAIGSDEDVLEKEKELDLTERRRKARAAEAPKEEGKDYLEEDDIDYF